MVALCGVVVGLTAADGVHISESEVDSGCEFVFVVELHPLLEHHERLWFEDRGEVKITEFILFDDAVSFFVFGSFTE